MSAFSLQWYGDEEKKLVSDIAESNVKRASKRVVRSAKRRVKKDTFKLRNSIKAQIYKKTGLHIAYISAGVRGEEHISLFIELGTPGEIFKKSKTEIGAKKKGKERTPIKPEPYMRPAIREEKKRYLKSFRNRF